jgi:hypothetical protein
MSGAVPPIPRYAFMAWCSVKKSTGTALVLPVLHGVKTWFLTLKTNRDWGCLRTGF